jgi:hypothetical protein
MLLCLLMKPRLPKGLNQQPGDGDDHDRDDDDDHDRDDDDD